MENQRSDADSDADSDTDSLAELARQARAIRRRHREHNEASRRSPLAAELLGGHNTPFNRSVAESEMAYAEGTDPVFSRDGVLVTQFNLNDERTMGHFDDAGFFVFDNPATDGIAEAEVVIENANWGAEVVDKEGPENEVLEKEGPEKEAVEKQVDKEQSSFTLTDAIRANESLAHEEVVVDEVNRGELAEVVVEKDNKAALAEVVEKEEPENELSVTTQRLEELASKQSRQLVPVTPSMPKGLVDKEQCSGIKFNDENELKRG